MPSSIDCIADLSINVPQDGQRWNRMLIMYEAHGSFASRCGKVTLELQLSLREMEPNKFVSYLISKY